MKQIRFSDLPTSSQVYEADVFPIIQDGDNKKAQQSSIKDYSQYKNIPKVNGRALSGNVTLDELGAQAPGEYLTEKELLDADLVTKVENANKADKNYGAENSGKYLGTDENGEIAPIDVKFSDDNKIIKMAQGNPIIINDSYEGKLKKLNIYGQSEQASTTGAQLLNLPTGTFTNEEGQSFKVNDDMTVDVNSPAFENGCHDVIINLETPIDVVQGQTNLRLFFEGPISSFASFLLVDDEGNSILSIELMTSYTGMATKTGRAIKFYYRQQNTGGVIAKGLKFMVSQSSITDYEPYTGGKPSPSLDYPQEIISKEVSEIKLYGTNLFDLEKEKLVPNTNWNEERQCFYPKAVAYYIGMVINEAWDIAHESNSILTVSFDVKADKNGKASVYVLGNRAIKLVQGNNDKFDVTQEYTRKSVKWLTIDRRGQPEQSGQGDNCGLSFYGVVDGESVIPEVKNICISITENTEYIPFESQVITLTEPITLRGVPVSNGGNITFEGNQYIADILKEKDGVVGIERNIAHYEITGNENVRKFTDGSFFYISDLPRKSLSSDNGLCTHCKYLYIGSGNDKVGICVAQRSATCRFNLELETVEEYKAVFKQAYDEGNPFKVDYHAEPTFEPLPEEIQAQYKALKSYYPNTVIQTGCWNETEYEVSLQSFIEDMYEKIEKVNNNNNKLLL